MIDIGVHMRTLFYYHEMAGILEIVKAQFVNYGWSRLLRH